MDMIKYYKDNEIIPVHQDLPNDNFGKFKFQRESLYSNLGITLSWVENKSILEFGPGTGDNAAVLAQFKPSKLDLVDGNPASRDSILNKIQKNLLPKSFTDFYFSDARNFPLISKDRNLDLFQGYDLVICEGVINGNSKPGDFLKYISHFVKPGGILVFTTVSSLGILDQALRRLWKPAIFAKCSNYMEQVQLASTIFKKHLKHLPTTKPIEDWVQDAILHPLDKEYVFSTVDAMHALGDKYTPIGSSPRFFYDFIWHKSLEKSNSRINLDFINQFRFIEPLFMDDRLRYPFEHTAALNKLLDYDHVRLVSEIWTLSCEIWKNNSYNELSKITLLLEELCSQIQFLFPEIYESIIEFLDAIPNIVSGDFESELLHFQKWWGRGLNYLAVKRIA